MCRTVKSCPVCRHQLSKLSVSQAADLAGALQAHPAATAHEQIEAMVAERRQWVADLQRHQAAADQALGAVQVGLQGCRAWRSVLRYMWVYLLLHSCKGRLRLAHGPCCYSPGLDKQACCGG